MMFADAPLVLDNTLLVPAVTVITLAGGFLLVYKYLRDQFQVQADGRVATNGKIDALTVRMTALELRQRETWELSDARIFELELAALNPGMKTPNAVRIAATRRGMSLPPGPLEVP